MTKICGIYAIVHRDSGRRYIGSSTHVAERWGAHKRLLRRGRSKTPRLQQAWDSYGADAFDWEILEECAAADLIAREAAHLTLWTPLLLNHFSTPFIPVGAKLSPETRARMSESRMGRKRTPEARANIRLARQSKEFRQWLANGGLKRA